MKIMTSVSLAGDKKMELNTGSFVTHGEAIGDKMEHSDSLEESIISTLKVTALGLSLLIPGLMMSEIKLNWLLRTECLKVNSKLRSLHAEEILLS